MTTSMTNGSGRKILDTANSANASSKPRHHRNAFTMPSKVAFTNIRPDRVTACELGHDAPLFHRVDLVRNRADQRQVLLHDQQGRLSAQLSESFSQVSD